MMAHELLRQAAQIIGTSWSKRADARNDAGSIVPLHSGKPASGCRRRNQVPS